MKLNSLKESIILWALVALFACLWSIIRKKKTKRIENIQNMYVESLIDLLPKVKDSYELLTQLFYRFSGNKPMRKRFLKALKKLNNSMICEASLNKAFGYIENYIGNRFIIEIHEKLIRIDVDKGRYPQGKISELVLEIEKMGDKWINEKSVYIGILKKQRLKLLIEKIIFLIGNFWFLNRYQSEISLGILVIVNTIGLMWLIVLDYDCGIENGKSCDGNLARYFRNKKRALTTSIKIQEVYQIVGGLGLIINLMPLATQWLEQVI